MLGIPDWPVLVKLREVEEQQERGRLERLRRVLGGALHGRLLNVGCGTGGFNVVAEEAGVRPVGVDADAEAIAICALKREKAGGAFVRAVAERLPFPDATFDVVYCFSAIEHVESVEATVAEMVRVARPGGLVYVHTPNAWSWYEGHYKLLWAPFLPAPRGPALPAPARAPERVPRDAPAAHPDRPAARLRAGGRAGSALLRRRAAPRVARAASRADRTLLPALRRLAVHRAGGAQAVTSILFACEYYPPFAPGGAEWSTAAWAAALARRGHRVTVVTPNYGAAPREERDGATIIRVPFPVKLVPGQGEARFTVHRNPLFHLYFAWQVWRAARAADARIVHAQGKSALVAAWLAGRALGRPVLLTIRDIGLLCPLGHCTIFEPWERFDCGTAQYVGKCLPYHLAHYAADLGVLGRARVRASALAAWLDNRLRQQALRRVDGVIGVSRGILDVFPLRLLPAARRQWAVPNPPPPVAVPSEAEARAARARLGLGAAPVVLYAGKLSAGKGTPVLLEALDRIAAAVPGVRFVLAGKGGMAIPTRPDLHVLGVLPQPELFALYRAADVVVVPSVWPEPLSRVLLEAMRIGRPVVATAVGGTPDAVEHGVTGLLVPRQDPEALAKAVIELLLDPERRERMGRAAAERAALHVLDEHRLVDALLDAYREVASA